MSDLNLQATVSADGKQASAELKKLAGNIGATKQAMVEAQLASRVAADALKVQTRAATEDAAAIDRLRDALVAARTAEALATREHVLAAAAMNTQGRAAQNLAGSTGQARASMANLGQQVGDIAQGIALGTSAFTILAQQGGQVAFAMSGMGGVLGRVATFLSGPWGAALLGGAIVLGSLSRGHDDAAGAAEKQSKAEKDVAEALETFRRASGLAAQSNREAVAAAREKISLLIDEKEKALDAAESNLTLAKARLAAVEADRPKDNAGIGRAGNFGINYVQQNANRDVERERKAIAELSGEVGKLRTERGGGDAFAAAFRDAEIKTNAARAAAIRYDEALDAIRAKAKAGLIDRATATAEIAALMQQKKASEDAARGQGKAAKDLAAENQKLTEAYNPLLAAQQEYKKSLDDIAKAETRGIATVGLAAEARLAAAEKLRQSRLKALGATPAAPIQLAGAGALGDSLGAQVFAGDQARELEAVVDKIGKDLGIKIGSDFGKKALELSQLIGDGLAGGFGRALQRSNAIAGILENLVPGSGGLFQQASGEAIQKGFKPLKDGLEKIFGGDGKLTKVLGKAAGGAAVGAAISDVFNGLGISKNKKGASIGGQVGGAIGAATGIPGGALIGSVFGSLVGGLFKGKNPFADAKITTTATGVSSSIFNQRGADSAEQGSSIAGTVGNQLQAIASALGAEIKAGINLGAIGFSGDQYYFNPTGGDFKAAGNQRFQKPEEAVAAAVASALGSGAVTASPRVQAVLQRYASDVNMAVVEALKVKDLEQLLEARGNPFLSAFKDFERQAAQRLDAARKYGFEVVEIEKINAEQRSALIRDTLSRATGSARALLDDFRFGSRASGSIREQLGALGGERDRLAGLVRGGDGGSLDALTSVLSQIDDLQREAFGATGEAAGGRASSTALLQELVDATEARVRAAAEEARKAAETQTATLQSMDGTLEDMFKLSQQQLAALQGIQAGLGGGGARSEFLLANTVARS